MADTNTNANEPKIIDHRDDAQGVEINNTSNDAESKIIIYGSKYNDTINNEGVNVTIDGGNGDDLIYSNGADGKGASAVIDAGTGNDTIYIGNLNTVSGGIGSDLFIYNTGKGNATINDYSAYQDNDIIQVDGNANAFGGLNESGNDYIVKVGSYELTLKDAKRNASSLRFRLNDYDSITSSVSDLNMDASERAAIIDVSGDRVTIKSSDSDDTIKTSGESNVVNAGNGANSIISSGKDTSIIAGGGNDFISLVGSGDTVSPGDGNDVVTIGANSYYKYTSGSDIIHGYSNSDTIEVNVGKATDVSVAFISGSSDVNVKIKDVGNVDRTFTIKEAKGKNLNIIDAAHSFMTGFNIGDSVVTEINYNLSGDFTGTDNADYVVNYSDGAKIDLGKGNDTLKLDGHNAYVQYTSGTDVVLSFDSTDHVSLAYESGIKPFIGASVSGNDLVIFARDREVDSDTLILKDVKNQTVNVTRANDQVLTALNGNVTLHGPTSEDIFYYKAGSGNQTIVGYDGKDSIVTSTDTSVTNAAIKNNNVVFAIGNSSLTVKDGASNRLNIVGYGAQEYGEKSIEVENLDGDTVNATLNTSVVTIDGAASRTTSVYLIGNKNNNKILGTEKVSSTLHGGTGNDTLTGGNTSDTFVYSSGKDVITNYNGYAAWSTVEAEKSGSTDTDVIYLSGVQLGSHSISGTDVVFTLGSGSLTVKDAKNKQITFVNEAGEIDTGTTKIYRSDKEFIVTNDDITSLKTAQNIPAGTADSSVTVTVTAADAKVTLIDANLELNNSTGTTLKYTNLYISGYKDTANSLKASKYGNDTLVGSTKADTLVGSGSVIETITAADGTKSTVEVGGSDTYLYKYGMGKDVIVNYKEADKIFFTSTDTTLTGSTLKSGNITFTVTDLKGKNKSTFVVRDVAGKKITFANEDGNLYSQVFGTTAITVSNEDEATVNTKPNTAVKTIDASTRTEDIYILGNSNANSIKGGTGTVTLQGGAGKDTLTRGDNSNTTFAFGSNEGTANVVTSYIAGSDTIKVLSGALTATATIKNSNDLTFTIGKTKVRVKDAKGKAITVVDANDTSTTQVYGLASISVADKDADVGATVNTAANSTVVTIDAAERTNAIYLAGNAKGNYILAGTGNETIATAKGKDTVAISDFNENQHVIITDYVSGTDKIRLASGVTIVAAETLKSGSTNAKLDGATLAADTMLLTLQSETGNSTVTSYLAVEGAITTKKGKTTYGKITVIDDTNGFTYSQAYGVDSIAVANADGATVDTNGNNKVKIINAKKRTSKAVIIGNDNVNSIIGGTKNDTIYAGNFGATINAASGNDWIFGSVDNSDTSISVTGGAGKDTIVAGLGKNTLSGGKGNDVFVFEVIEGKGTQGGEDTILDFTTGTNTLRLESGTTLAASSLRGNDTFLTLQGASANDTKAIKLSNLNGKKITIYDGTTGVTTKQAYGVESIAVANGDAGTIDGSAAYNTALKIINGKKLTKSIYLIGNDNNGSKLVGGSKADTLRSGSGSTTMTGGKGDDLFIYGGGSDTITDYSIVNKNNDVLQFAIGNPTYYHVEGKNVILEFSDTAEHAVTTNTLTIVNGKDKKFNFKDGTPSFGDLDRTFDGIFDDYTQLILAKDGAGEVKTGTSLDYRTTYINASKKSSAVTIWGNDSDSTIVASAKADNIKGGSEDDLITTGKGKDTISISGGNDTITDYAVGSDVIHLNGFKLESAKTDGNDVVFTVKNGGETNTLRIQNAMKKGLMQKITIYDDATRRTTSQAYGTSQSQITIAGGDGDTIDLNTDVNSGVKLVDASKRKAKEPVYINGNAQSNTLKGGAGNDTLIGGDGGSDILIGGKGDDSLVGGTGSTTFDPGKGDDMIVISTASNRGKASITYTAGGDKIYNYKSTDSISLSTSAKATSATQKGDGTYTINFKSGGSLEVFLAAGEQASDTFKINKTTATKVSGSKSKKGGTGSDSGTTVYDWTINYYVSVSNIRDVKISNVSKSVSKAANETEALKAASSYEERFYSELFADDVLISADDLSEIAATNVDKAAIAVDLTTTNSLTDFKADTESLTTIIQTDKNKK